ncbi:hypothetical protein [Candidatus Symbiopectobacterium sp. NZEC135]|uniref:hypothetical protein n=1 Tax=Candidatus Symbiopectobacterium sp. NZEC135 TaxID=2820471 RepID=UPI0022262894|nr:hypothetical protein [Candidatus Symbiopectobacterium sp. NZEC135]MCW2481029.1 hypothetical protein [Candidatus Symbiopectobacterium sp. NZEC135]
MPSNIVFYDLDSFFVLGAKALLNTFEPIYIAVTQQDVIELLKRQSIDILIIDPLQRIWVISEDFLASVRSVSEKTKIVFLIESKNKSNFYINRLSPHLVIEKNIDPAIFVKVLELLNVGINANKV